MFSLVEMRTSTDYKRAQSLEKLNVWPMSSMVTFCNIILKLALLGHSLPFFFSLFLFFLFSPGFRAGS